MAKRRLLDIQPEELAELQFIVRSGKAEQRLVERAQIILCWQEGKSFVETQQKLGVSEVIINKWRAEWINSKKRITLHFTPTYSSWLNQIEIWFNMLTKDVLKGGIWKSRKQLIDQLMKYVKTYNEQRAKPFKWTYTGKPLAI